MRALSPAVPPMSLTLRMGSSGRRLKEVRFTLVQTYLLSFLFQSWTSTPSGLVWPSALLDPLGPGPLPGPPGPL